MPKMAGVQYTKYERKLISDSLSQQVCTHIHSNAVDKSILKVALVTLDYWLVYIELKYKEKEYTGTVYNI